MNKNIRFSDRMVLVGIGLTLFYWLLDSIMYISITDELSVIKLIIGPDLYSTWTRLLILVLFLTFGTHVQLAINIRKDIENRLKQSEKRFRIIVENSFFGTLIINKKGEKIIFSNLEKNLSQILPDSGKIKDLNIHPEDNKLFKNLLKPKPGSPESQGLDMEIRFFPAVQNEYNNLIWTRCQSAGIEYDSRDAVLLNIMDITRAKELEQIAITREKMVSLGHMAAGIAHEIRNPLSSINLFFDAYKNNNEDDEDLTELLDYAVMSAAKMESLIKRVLDFSKSDNIRLEKADINQAIEDAVKLSFSTLEKSGIEIDINLNKNIPEIYIDSQLIEQVILSLISNAKQAVLDNDKDKKIIIESGLAKSDIYIKISDSGKGIPLELLEKVFEPFVTFKYGGTGIGLNFCQKVINFHNGVIQAGISTLGGAEFSIRLPVKPGKDIDVRKMFSG